jgi:hypothetical protein
VPFTLIDYITAPDTSGIRLVFGNSTLAAFSIRSLPLPSSPNEAFSNTSIELAPGQFFSDVLVPTSAERGGDFRDFGGIITDPLCGCPFPGNIVPAVLLGRFYAFRLAPASAVPESSSLVDLALGGILAAIFLLVSRRWRLGSASKSAR